MEVDIRSFFDELDRRQLRAFLDRRVRDGVIRRTIDKWLKVGVLEDGVLSHPESPRRFILAILGAFAGTALILAALGIYAVLSFSVSQRVPEIGIRMVSMLAGYLPARRASRTNPAEALRST